MMSDDERDIDIESDVSLRHSICNGIWCSAGSVIFLHFVSCIFLYVRMMLIPMEELNLGLLSVNIRVR